MKKIEAYLRSNALESVKEALEDAQIYALTVETVKGYGRQQGQTDLYRGSTYAQNLIPKLRITVVVQNDMVEAAIAAICEASQTGEIGDGKIFISDVEDVIRIRTGERGEAAIQ